MPTISPDRTEKESGPTMRPRAATVSLSDAEHHLARRVIGAPAQLRQLAADDAAGDRLLRGFGQRRRLATSLPPRMTLTRSAISITSSSLWVISTIALPAARKLRSASNSRSFSLRRQHGGRLVEDQHLGLAVEHLEDLHHLPLADRQPPHLAVEVDGDAVIGRHPRLA